MRKSQNARVPNPAPSITWRRGIGIPVFSCDLCGSILDQRYAVDWDGLWVCRPYCATLTSPSELDELWADQQAQADSFTPIERPPAQPFAGGSGVNERIPESITVSDASSVAEVEFIGFGLALTDAVACQHPNVICTVDSVNADGTEAVVSFDKNGADPGEYWISYNGVRYSRMIKVL